MRHSTHSILFMSSVLTMEQAADMPAVAGAAAAAAESSAIVSSSDHDHPVASSSAAGGHRGAASAAAAAYDSSDDETGHHGSGSNGGGAPLPDPHYDENQDEEDEAWVYRHMRGGQAEEVMMAVPSRRAREDDGDEQASAKGAVGGEGSQLPDVGISAGATDSQGQHQRGAAQDGARSRPAQPDMSKVMMLKPRNSDAVLSCPCCFTIVCMDCQRHVKYNNQYRAMFVMNIGVAWHKRLRWDDAVGELVEMGAANDTSSSSASTSCEQTMKLDSVSGSGPNNVGGDRTDGIPNAVPGDSCDEGHASQKNTGGDSAEPKPNSTAGNTNAHLEGDDEIYYSVYCASCNTEVAYLNMDDEVYHFVNCLASG